MRVVKAILEGFHFPLNTDDMEDLTDAEKAKRTKIAFTVNDSLLPRLANKHCYKALEVFFLHFELLVGK